MDKQETLRFPPKNILVPLDLSEAAAHAWKEAKRLGDKFNATVDGLYVQEWLYASLGPGIEDAYITSQVRTAALKGLREKLGISGELRSAVGGIKETILSWGKGSAYDLIVMGTHARTGLERMLKGSVAETVVRHATIPVWVVKEPRPIKSVLAPVSFDSYSYDGLLAAARVAEKFGAKLTVLHVVDAPFYGGANAVKGPKHLLADAANKLPAALRQACQVKTALEFGSPAEQIVAAAAEADLVALIAHRKGFLNDTILGTTAERVLRYAPCSVIALPMEVAVKKAKAGARGEARSPSR